MSLSRRNPKRDGNEAAIRQALEAQGFVVQPVSGKGIPDLVVAYQTVNHIGQPQWLQWWVEIKQPKGKYTISQVQWRQRWRGPAPITLRSVDDACHFALIAMSVPSDGGKA